MMEFTRDKGHVRSRIFFLLYYSLKGKGFLILFTVWHRLFLYLALFLVVWYLIIPPLHFFQVFFR